MKNPKSGFIVPLLLGIVAILVIGGGAYVYLNQHKSPATSSTNENGNESVPPLRDFNESTTTASTSINSNVSAALGPGYTSCYVNYDKAALIAQLKQKYDTLPLAFPAGVNYDVYNMPCQNANLKLFANVENVDAGAAGNGYRIVFSGENGCTAHVCETAFLNVHPQTLAGVTLANSQFQTEEKVTLKDGVTGYYQQADCGAVCSNPEISFMHTDGTLFTFSAGMTKTNLIRWVNSALPVIDSLNAIATPSTPPEAYLLQNVDTWIMSDHFMGNIPVCSNGNVGTGKNYVFFMGSRGYDPRPGDVDTPHDKVINILKNSGWQQCKFVDSTELQDTQSTSEVFFKGNRLIGVYRHYSMGTGNSLGVSIQFP